MTSPPDAAHGERPNAFLPDGPGAAEHRRLLSEITRQEKPSRPAEPLTEREVEVLRWVARGLNNEGIAEALDISAVTASTLEALLTRLDGGNVRLVMVAS